MVKGVVGRSALFAAGVVTGIGVLLGPFVGPLSHAGAASKRGADTEKAIADAIAFVERERGLRFITPPKVVALPEAEFLKRLDRTRTTDESYEEDIRGFSALLRALGFVKGNGKPEKLLDSLLDGAVGGFYDPRTKELVVRSADTGPLWRTIVVHELTHALDDQHFGLDRPELERRNDDAEAAFQYLAEGSARVIENRYRAKMSAADRATAAQEEMSMGGQDALFDLVADPDYRDAMPFMFTSLLAPYEVGKDFVGSLVARKGRAGLDEAFRSPPETTEQVADLARYLRREPARSVARPEVPAGAKVVDSGVVGLGSLDALLATRDTLTDIGAIDPAASGWGGDAYVVWTLSTRECFRMDIAMDTPNDRAELRRSLSSFAATRPDAQVEDRPAGLVRFTSCGRSR